MPEEDGLSVETGFQFLIEGVLAQIDSIDSAVSMQWLRLCVQDLESAKAAYASADEVSGLKHLQSALARFDDAITNRPMTADLVVDIEGRIKRCH